MIIFEWNGIKYRVGAYDKHNIAVGRLRPDSKERRGDGSIRWGRATYYKDWESAFIAIAKEGCRQVDGKSIDEIIHSLSRIREEFARSIRMALNPDAVMSEEETEVTQGVTPWIN